VQALVVNQTVGAGEIDQLEKAGRVTDRLEARVRTHARGIDLDDLARHHLALERGADGGEGAALGGDDPMIAEAADAEGRTPSGSRTASRRSRVRIARL
jgi:hypothetical protein